MSEGSTQADKELANHLIDKYRELLGKRYDYERIERHMELPDTITEEVVEDVKTYFMENMYPSSEDRERVDRAFDQLRSYIYNPRKVWGLVGNMTSAVFKFGMQFPAALRAGFVTLEAYLDARKFEQKLLEAALNHGYEPPLNDEQFCRCMREIPRSESEAFINDIQRLFDSLSDTTLLKKTISILESVSRTMKRRPSLYSKDEIEGIYLGIGILENGYKLFRFYDRDRKKAVIETIVKNEEQFLDEIYDEVQ